MITYWSASFISVLMTWFVTHIKQKNNRFYLPMAAIFSSFPLIFISAIRYNVGADYMPYYRYYMDVIAGAGQGRFEILYYGLNLCLAFFNMDFPWLFFFVAVLFLCPIYIRLIEDSPYPGISAFLIVGMTYYFYFLNGARQMIAAAFLMASVPFVAKNKFFPFALLVLIASGFHTTSIIFLGIYLLVRLNFGIKLLAGLTTVVFVFAQTIGNIGNQIIASFSYYETYLDSVYATRGQGYIVLCMNILITIFCTIFYQRGNKLYKGYYTMHIISLWASALTGTIVLIDRFRMVFGLADIILIPMAIHQIHNRNLRIATAFTFVLLYFIYATYTAVVQNSNMVLPYQTIFS